MGKIAIIGGGAFGTGMVERQRGDLVFVSSDTALRALLDEETERRARESS